MQIHPDSTVPGQRYASLDLIRGVAVLGILIMNIQSFAMPEAAYLNPRAYGNLEGADFFIWLASHLFADSKFITLFSMLFGASVLLISDKREAEGCAPWRLHYSRNFWLLLIGAVHAYGFWYGDILFPYALCGMLVYLFRKRSAVFLAIAGILFFSVASGFYYLAGSSLPNWPEEAVESTCVSWAPSEEALQQEIDAYQGSFAKQMKQRVESTLMMQTFVFVILMFWRVTGCMLIGMALYKSGFFTAQWSATRYGWIALALAGVGFGMVGYGAFRIVESNWTMEYAMFLGFQWNYWGSVLVALAYASALQWLSIKGGLGRVSSALCKVGRLALSNYLLQTLIATSVFYGFGLGWFGEVSRVGQAVIVLLIWLLNIVFSLTWSRHFRYGPAEWLWRSLTLLRIVPISKPTSLRKMG